MDRPLYHYEYVDEGDVPLCWRADRHAALFQAVQAKPEISALSLEPPLSARRSRQPSLSMLDY